MSGSAGLCAVCRHARTVENRRGSRFWLCAMSRTDPRFPRYPPLPVLRCAGYSVGTPASAAPTRQDETTVPDTAVGTSTEPDIND
jgi:hypothetical protein